MDRETMSYTPTADARPPKNVPIEWIAPDGRVQRGHYHGGAVWFPEGSGVYIYYTPTFWRLAALSTTATGETKRNG
jgi:hypothetical protein